MDDQGYEKKEVDVVDRFNITGAMFCTTRFQSPSRVLNRVAYTADFPRQHSLSLSLVMLSGSKPKPRKHRYGADEINSIASFTPEWSVRSSYIKRIDDTEFVTDAVLKGARMAAGRFVLMTSGSNSPSDPYTCTILNF